MTPQTAPHTALPTLADLTARTGLDVLDHLERQVTVPVVGGLQAQGDLVVVPHAMLPFVTEAGWDRWRDVPASGVELLRSAGGGNPHTLTADPGACRWTSGVRDTQGLALALIENTSTAYLLHPEHGANGIAPGRWVVRRQRERTHHTGRPANRLVAD